MKSFKLNKLIKRNNYSLKILFIILVILLIGALPIAGLNFLSKSFDGFMLSIQSDQGLVNSTNSSQINDNNEGIDQIETDKIVTDEDNKDEKVTKSLSPVDSIKPEVSATVVPVAQTLENTIAVMEIADDNKTVTFYEGTGEESETQKFYPTVFEAMAHGWSYSQNGEMVSGDVKVKLLHDWDANDSNQFGDTDLLGFGSNGKALSVSQNNTILDLNGFTIDGNWYVLNYSYNYSSFFDLGDNTKFSVISTGAEKGSIKNVLMNLIYIKSGDDTALLFDNLNIVSCGFYNLFSRYSDYINKTGSLTLNNCDISNCQTGELIYVGYAMEFRVYINNCYIHGNYGSVGEIALLTMNDTTIVHNDKRSDSGPVISTNDCKLGGLIRVFDNKHFSKYENGIGPINYNYCLSTSDKPLDSRSYIEVTAGHLLGRNNDCRISDSSLKDYFNFFVCPDGNSLYLSNDEIHIKHPIAEDPTPENQYKVVLSEDVAKYYSFSYQWYDTKNYSDVDENFIGSGTIYNEYNKDTKVWKSNGSGYYFGTDFNVNEKLIIPCEDAERKIKLLTYDSQEVLPVYNETDKQFEFDFSESGWFVLVETDASYGTLQNIIVNNRPSIDKEIPGQIYSQLYYDESVPGYNQVICKISATPKSEYANLFNSFNTETLWVDIQDQPSPKPSGVFVISFDPTGGACEQSTAETQNGVLVSLPVPAREDWTFVGWFNNVGEQVIAGQTEFTSETTLYAKWEGSTHTVNFAMNGHGEQIESVEVENGHTVYRPEDPIAEGYGFMGWYKDSELTTKWDFLNDFVTSDVTLYAKWAVADKVMEVIADEKTVVFSAALSETESNEKCFTDVNEAMAHGWDYSQTCTGDVDEVTVKLYHDWKANNQHRFTNQELLTFTWDGHGMYSYVNTIVDLNGYNIDGNYSEKPGYGIETSLFNAVRATSEFVVTSTADNRGGIINLGSLIYSDEGSDCDAVKFTINNTNICNLKSVLKTSYRALFNTSKANSELVFDSIDVKDSLFCVFVYPSQNKNVAPNIRFKNSRIYDNSFISISDCYNGYIYIVDTQICNNNIFGLYASSIKHVMFYRNGGIYLGGDTFVQNNKDDTGSEIGIIIYSLLGQDSDTPLSEEASICIQPTTVLPYYDEPVTVADASLKNNKDNLFNPDGYVVNSADEGLELTFPILQQPASDNDYVVSAYPELEDNYSLTYQWYSAKSSISVTDENATATGSSFYDKNTDTWTINTQKYGGTYFSVLMRAGQKLCFPINEQRVNNFEVLTTDSTYYTLKVEYIDGEAVITSPVNCRATLKEYVDEGPISISNVRLDGVLSKDQPVEGQNFKQLYEPGMELEGAICEIVAIPKAGAVKYNAFSALSSPVKIDQEHKPQPKPEGKYIVYLDPNGGVCFDLTVETENGVITSLPTPYLEGKYFYGWYLDASTKVIEGQTKFSENSTIIAKWGDEQIKYTVSFDSMGKCGNPQSQEVAEGGYVNEPTTPTVTGYTLTGWYKESTLINQWDFQHDTVTQDITLYAKWQPNTIVATFTDNYEGGSSIDIDQTFDSNYELPEVEPVRAGYKFKGWFSESTGGLQITSKTKVTNDVDHNVYAQWDLATVNHTVTFNNMGKGDAPKQQIIGDGEKVSEPPMSAVTGYMFEGWYTEDTFEYKWDFENDTVQNNMTLYAKWSPNKYMATFDANEGEFDEGATSIAVLQTYDAHYVFPHDSWGFRINPERKQYQFVGWFTDPESGEQVTEDWIFKQITEQTLYAHWQPHQVIVPEGDPDVSVDKDELQKVANNIGKANPDVNKIKVELTVDNDILESDTKLIKQQIDNKKLIAKNVNIFYELDDDPQGKYTENEDIVTVTYTFDFNDKKDVEVVRVHDDEFATLTTTPNEDGEYIELKEAEGKVSVHAVKYSTYGIAYNTGDAPAPSPVVDGSTYNSGSGKTGDTNVFMLLGIFSAAIAAAGTTVLVRRKLND